MAKQITIDGNEAVARVAYALSEVIAIYPTGGVHSGDDAAKAILCGAHTVQLASSLLAHGPDQLKKILSELRTRLDGIGYRALSEARGVLSLEKSPDPHGERLNYARLLKSWQSP